MEKQPPEERGRSSFSYDPRVPDPEIEPGEIYGLLAPESGAESPLRLDNQNVGRPAAQPKLAHETEMDELAEPGRTSSTERRGDRPQRRRKKGAAGSTSEPNSTAPRDRILDRHERAPKYPWWLSSAIASGLGMLGILIAIGVTLARVKQTDGVVAGYMVALAACVILVETLLFTGFVWLAGQIFQIDYGPVGPALVKIAATVLLLNGVALVAMLISPVGIMLAGIVAMLWFQAVFQLDFQESIISTALILLGSFALNAFVMLMLLLRQAEGRG